MTRLSIACVRRLQQLSRELTSYSARATLDTLLNLGRARTNALKMQEHWNFCKEAKRIHMRTVLKINLPTRDRDKVDQLVWELRKREWHHKWDMARTVAESLWNGVTELTAQNGEYGDALKREIDATCWCEARRHQRILRQKHRRKLQSRSNQSWNSTSAGANPLVVGGYTLRTVSPEQNHDFTKDWGRWIRSDGGGYWIVGDVNVPADLHKYLVTNPPDARRPALRSQEQADVRKRIEVEAFLEKLKWSEQRKQNEEIGTEPDDPVSRNQEGVITPFADVRIPHARINKAGGDGPAHPRIRWTLNSIPLGNLHKPWTKREAEVVKKVKETSDFKVIKSDKTARWCVVSEQVWQQAVEDATRGDEEETDMKRVREWQNEDQLVAHALAETLGVDNGWTEKKKHRLNCSPGEVPRARIMIKDHKPNLGFRAVIGYGVSDGKLDGLVASALSLVVDQKRTAADSTEVDSTEALIDATESMNQNILQQRALDSAEQLETVLILLDVVALYPSLIASDVIDVMHEVKEELMKKGIPCVSSTEAVLRMLAAASIDPQVQASGLMNAISEELKNVIPTRRSTRGRPPGYGSSMSSWNYRTTEIPMHLQCEAAAVAIAVGCIRSFRSHVALDNRVFRREGKGAIGSKTCGEIAGSVMRRLDVRLKDRLNHGLRQLGGVCEGEPVSVYKRYVDDVTVMARVGKGVSKDELERVVSEATKIEEKPHLKFTANVVKPGESGVVLDMTLSVKLDGTIQRRFYKKPFAMVKQSGSYVEETFRRLRNTTTSRKDQEEDLEQYMAQLRTLGISERTIRNSVVAGIRKYNEKVVDGSLIRNADDRAAARRENRRKKDRWFDKEGKERPVLVVEEGTKQKALHELKRLQSGGVLQALPGVPLVVERHAAMEYQLLAPRNSVDVHCKKRNRGELCMKDVGGDCNGECVKRSVVYELRCLRCNLDTRYIGETSRALGQRIAEHEADYIGRREASWAWHHVERKHEGEQNRFGEDFKVVQCTREKGAFRRPLREEVCITRWSRMNRELLNDHTGFSAARDLLEVIDRA